MKTFVIKVRYGGLGDHLFWSHLPRIAKLHGYDKVCISKLSDFRDSNYYKLIWELNPYIDGMIEKDAPYPEFAEVDASMNLLDRIMLERQLDDNQRFHEPELFYQPKLIPELEDKAVFDPNYLSYVGNISNEKLIETLEGEKIDFQMSPRSKMFGVLNNVPVISAVDIFNYCDIIKSCERFYCLTSGGSTLAAALGKCCVAFYGKGQKPMFHHSKIHRYVEV